MWPGILPAKTPWAGEWLSEDVHVLYMCAGVLFLTYMPTSMAVCACTRAWSQVRGRGGQIGRGQWGSECMMGVGLCSLFALCQSRAWEGSEGGGGKVRREGAARADPVEKLHRRRKRTRNKLRGNSIKKGGCQSGLSWLPHPVLCAKFQERLSPRSRVGGD